LYLDILGVVRIGPGRVGNVQPPNLLLGSMDIALYIRLLEAVLFLLLITLPF
jgi:hypothetical protein